MNKEHEFKYYELFENMIREMTDTRGYKPEAVKNSIKPIAELFDITKAVTFFYESLNEERKENGEERTVIIREVPQEKEVWSVRIVNPNMTVVTASAYRQKDAPPLTQYEAEKIDLTIRTIMNFIARMRMLRAIEQIAFHDPWGLRNQRYFHRYMERTNQQHQLGGKVAFNYNLRHFSLVNQEIGRPAGDTVIRNHYDGLCAIIGDRGVVCRLGGDNFVGICSKEQVDQVVAYLTSTPVIYDITFNKRIRISATAGFYRIPEDFYMNDPGQILDKIITSAQIARSGRREQIIFYDSRLAENRERAMHIQHKFPLALQNEEFRVFYQPKIDIMTGEITGAEALCRWFQNGEIVPPMAFIPILEQTTEICKLDFYMLDHVCRDIRRWLDSGLHVVRISVNLSRRHMMDIDLLQNIIEIIDRNNVPHQYLEVELTETTTDVEFRDLKRVVNGLQQAGIFTSVDDFGVGYSSLNLLREIPWDVLKVDKSFLPTEEDESESTRSIMFKYVVAMARELGLECIAEGVETQMQVDVLRENQCLLAQGFFFDKPLPVEEFEKRLQGYQYPLEK